MCLISFERMHKSDPHKFIQGGGRKGSQSGPLFATNTLVYVLFLPLYIYIYICAPPHSPHLVDYVDYLNC